MIDPLASFAEPPPVPLRVRPTSVRLRWSIVVGRHGWTVAGICAALLVVGALLLAGADIRYRPLEPASAATPATASARARLRRRLEAASPRGRYVVIDRANNRLSLRDGDRVVLQAACSTGSGTILRDPAHDREWTFDTPSGTFRVRRKLSRPVWRKPDWAFIEEGRPVPDDPNERFEAGVLGQYALDLGDGYLIHGTLYQRLIGRSVTHGCIRVGRRDLAELYGKVRVGTPVYIY